MKQPSKTEFISLIEKKLSRYFGTTGSEAGKEQLYKAFALVVKDILLEKHQRFRQKARAQNKKKVYYLCLEFLVGKHLKNSLYNLDMVDTAEEVLKGYGTSIAEMEQCENDPGLGNGGLGRLAACFMDALATGDFAATGYSIRYEFGLFRQKIVEGWQVETPDIWLPGGEVWLTQRSEKAFTVRFGGSTQEVWKNGKLDIEYHGGQLVEAVPYDVMVSGAPESAGVSVLRLWRPLPAHKFDMQSFSQGDYFAAVRDENDAELIGKVLYPPDSTYEGKTLRLKQQYFFVSASVQDIVYEHTKLKRDIRTLHEFAAIHINDTHPALCIPELMRILLDEYGLCWEDAWHTVTHCVGYTNHTVLAEALERWPEDMIARMFPRLHQIIREIDRRFKEDMRLRGLSSEQIDAMTVIGQGSARMANLSVIGSHSVNGVSKLHSDIIKESIFADHFGVTPQKFRNVTNGVAHRRWLCQGNPALTALLCECIGDGFLRQPERLLDFLKYKNDSGVLSRLAQIKRGNKAVMSDYALRKCGAVIDPDSIFDVQAKRLHEYKRQLMNVLRIISVYGDMLEHPEKDFLPQTYLFGAKAAPSYYTAKQIIKLIWALGEDIRKNPKVNGRLSVVFLEDYNVSMAERLMPSAELSQQISLAGKEASGTGNMKFMLNGALTMGTVDGANVEILDAVGEDNFFVFGLRADEVEALWRSGYRSTEYFSRVPDLRRVTDMLNRGFNGESFADCAQYLLAGHGVADPYMCLADYETYMAAHVRAHAAYRDPAHWNAMSLVNIAHAGIFAADRSIGQYARDIWGVTPVKN